MRGHATVPVARIRKDGQRMDFLRVGCARQRQWRTGLPFVALALTAGHELQVVENDVTHVVDIVGVIHGVQDVVHLGRGGRPAVRNRDWLGLATVSVLRRATAANRRVVVAPHAYARAAEKL